MQRSQYRAEEMGLNMAKNIASVIDWLLSGDVAIQYQTRRDFLSNDISELRDRISVEGWGAKLLTKRYEDGSWGGGFYQPK